MTITSADLMSVGKVALAIGGGAVIAYGARELGKIGGAWLHDQYKQWTSKTITQNPELIGGVAGSVLVASLLKKDTSLITTMILSSILLSTLAINKINLSALHQITNQCIMDVGRVCFFSGLVAIAGARYIGPGWGTLLGLCAVYALSQQKKSVE